MLFDHFYLRRRLDRYDQEWLVDPNHVLQRLISKKGSKNIAKRIQVSFHGRFVTGLLKKACVTEQLLHQSHQSVGYYEVQMDFETIQALKVSTSTLLTEFSVVFKTNVSLKWNKKNIRKKNKNIIKRCIRKARGNEILTNSNSSKSSWETQSGTKIQVFVSMKNFLMISILVFSRSIHRILKKICSDKKIFTKIYQISDRFYYIRFSIIGFQWLNLK